jgi:hypothetical protein
VGLLTEVDWDAFRAFLDRDHPMMAVVDWSCDGMGPHGLSRTSWTAYTDKLIGARGSWRTSLLYASDVDFFVGCAAYDWEHENGDGTSVLLVGPGWPLRTLDEVRGVVLGGSPPLYPMVFCRRSLCPSHSSPKSRSTS